MRLVLGLALRNLISHRVKTLIVGTIMMFGTVLVVVGLALLDGMEAAMRRSITGSIAGDFQLYDARAEDPLVLLGSTFISVPDVGRIDRFEDVHAVVSQVPGVEAVVPMGFDIGTITAPGPLESALDSLRAEVRAAERGRGDPAARARWLDVIQGLVEELADELETQKQISSEPERLDAELAELAPVLDGSLWARFDEAPLEVLEQLDTKVAPLDDGGRQLLFRFLGTDLGRFAENFSGFRMEKGTPVPRGQRGFLFSDKFYEGRVKHRVARALDNLLENVEEGLSIAEDPGQSSRVRRLARQGRRVSRDLDEEEARFVTGALRELLARPEGDLAELLEVFLAVDDESLRLRRDFFYEVIAPRIDLYALDIGDTLTVRTFTRSGFLRAVNVKLWGTFSFEGLESSDLAGIYNLTDLVTFRELFGVMTEGQRAELAELREKVGLTDVTSTEVEDALFGDGAEIVEEVQAEDTQIEAIEALRFGGAAERGLDDRVRPEELETGLVLDAAVVLEPDADPDRVRTRIEAAIASAELPIQVVDWQAVSGLVGQFIVVIRLVLYVAITIIFLVALVIINNSMVMATMERVTEIGTLRAIGAHRGLVLAMFFVETLSLGLLAGLAGAGIAAGLVTWWGEFGLTAPSRELRFLFGGPQLFPELSVYHLLAGLGAILVVSTVSSAYPAVLGASIQPVEAMRTEE